MSGLRVCGRELGFALQPYQRQALPHLGRSRPWPGGALGEGTCVGQVLVVGCDMAPRVGCGNVFM